MVLESLSAELERLYQLDELKTLSGSFLGLDPEYVGGAAAKGSFARALTQRCADLDAVDALVDVVTASRRTLPPELLAKLRNGGSEHSEQFRAGDVLGDWQIQAELGQSTTGTIYRAQHNGALVRLRRVSKTLQLRRRELQRFFAAARVASSVEHPAIPKLILAGQLDPSGRLVGVAQDYVEGVPLSDLIAERSGQHLNELLPLLWAILEALSEMHQAGVVHGALHAGNVLVTSESARTPKVALLDPGAHHLHQPLSSPAATHFWKGLVTASPELLRGEELGTQADVYSFGALTAQLLNGRGPFQAARPLDWALGHLTGEMESLLFTAAGNGATSEVDSFVRRLLEKDASRRPRDAVEAAEALRRLWRASQRPKPSLSDAQLEQRFQNLAEDPANDQLAAEIEALLDLGVDPLKLAEGLLNVARQEQSKETPGADRTIRRLLARAARLYDAGEAEAKAETLYEGLIQLDPEDAAIEEALDRLRRKRGKFAELIESLLERTERARTSQQRSSYFSEIGRVYSTELKDTDQALVAYAQALSEDPLNEKTVEAIERLAGSRFSAWEEVLGHCAEAAANELNPAEVRAELSYRVGSWYATRVARPDLALPMLLQAIELEPAHQRALSELCRLYRQAQQWAELSQTLLRRADVAPPNVARDLRAQAAETLAAQLGNPQAARDLYESVLVEDPGHATAAEGLTQLLRQAGDPTRALKVLEIRAVTLAGEARQALLLDVAEAYEQELNRLQDAERIYRFVLSENPKQLDALRGLDRILARGDRSAEFLEILRRELELALTARQKVALYERIATVYEEEYLDPKLAAEALEAVLDLDPQRASAALALTRHYRTLERWQQLAALLETRLAAEADPEQKVELGIQLAQVLADRLQQPNRAIDVYEQVLERAPGHVRALDALATLKATAGDAESAVSALDELALGAATPEARAEHCLRAAAILESLGNKGAALARYRMAIGACPDQPAIVHKVRRKYQELGDYNAAVELIEGQLERTDGSAARAKLAAEVALISDRLLKDAKRASAAVDLALSLDPRQPEALRVQGRLLYGSGHYAEAAARLEASIPQLESMDPEEALETAYAYIDSLAESGATEKALDAADRLLLLLAEDKGTLLRVYELCARHGGPERTLLMANLVLERHQGALDPADLGRVHQVRGEALAQLERLDDSLDSFERSIAADPSNVESLHAIGTIHGLREDWNQLIETRYRELDLVEGDERLETLVEIGEVAASKLNSIDYAARAFLLALDEHPNDRNILARLMQLYGAHKDWPQLLEVIVRLAELVDDPKQRGKYLQTAAMLAARELNDPTRALEFVELALDADPENQKVFREGVQLRRQLQDYEGLKELLKRRVSVLVNQEDKSELVEVLEQLGDVYENQLARRDQALRVFQSLLEINPDDLRAEARLARLYAAEPGVYFEQAISALAAWVQRDPYEAEPYKLLRKVYTEVRRGDGAFLACQALHVLGHAEPDEERFFERMRESDPPVIRRGLQPAEWSELIAPSPPESLLTTLFSLIEPYVIQSMAQPLQAFGVGSEHTINAEAYPYSAVLFIHAASEAFGIAEPVMLQNPDAPTVLEFLSTAPPSVLVGANAFDGSLDALETAFIAARHLAYHRPGAYLRQLLRELTPLKIWLFAAIRLVKTQFPVTPELEGPVEQANQFLVRSADAQTMQGIGQAVTGLLASETALDLKRWVREIDLVADRAGLALCHDLETAAALAQSLPTAPGGPTVEQRIENLLAYSVSKQYLELRQRQGVSID